MTNGLIGRKIAMTQIFDKEGNFIPVTLVETGPCTVLNVNKETNKVTLGFENGKENRIAKAQLGFFKKIGVTPKRVIKEFKYDEEALKKILEGLSKKTNGEVQEEAATEEPTFGVGSDITAEIFKPGDYVDVSGISVGKGFQGGMKRWNWKGGPASHGSNHKRRPGSIGQCADPSRVHKGKKLPGRMGGKRITTQGLRVMEVHPGKNLLLIKGAIPGSKNGLVEVRRSFKKKWQDLNTVKAVAKQSVNPMKQSKKGAK